MAKRVAVPIEDVVALALFAQRSPNTAFRDHAFTLALSALSKAAPIAKDLIGLSEFAARSKSKGVGANRAREVASRLLRNAGHADLQAQFLASMRMK